jgi:hypothetical protein
MPEGIAITQQQRDKVLAFLKRLDSSAEDREPLAAMLRIAMGEAEEGSFEKAAQKYDRERKLLAAAVLRLMAAEGHSFISPISYVTMSLFAPMLALCVAVIDEKARGAPPVAPESLIKRVEAMCDAELLPVLGQLNGVRNIMAERIVTTRLSNPAFFRAVFSAALDSTGKLVDAVRSITNLSAARAHREDGAADACIDVCLAEGDGEESRGVISLRDLERMVGDARRLCASNAMQAYGKHGLEVFLDTVHATLYLMAFKLDAVIKARDGYLREACRDKPLFADARRRFDELCERLMRTAFNENAACIADAGADSDAEASLDLALDDADAEATAVLEGRSQQTVDAVLSRLRGIEEGTLRLDRDRARLRRASMDGSI